MVHPGTVSQTTGLKDPLGCEAPPVSSGESLQTSAFQSLGPASLTYQHITLPENTPFQIHTVTFLMA